MKFEVEAFEEERNRIIDTYRRQAGGEDLPNKIHHYTNFDAATKIVSAKTLWLSHASFCNDPTELDYGLNIMRDAAQELNAEFVLELIGEAHYNLLYGGIQPFIFCLCRAEDNLTQWEMYAGRNGCCITFGAEINKLRFEGPPSEGTLGSVVYKTNVQKSLAKELCKQLVQHSNFARDREFQVQAFVTLINCAVFLKDPVFMHENEWRIVYLGGQANPSAIRYRAGSRFPIPYVEGSYQELPIRSITVGPSDDQKRLIMSMKHLMRMKGYQGVEIKASTIRFSPS